MKLEIKAEELKKKSIFLATPMYGGQAQGYFVHSCLELQALCMKMGIDIRFSFQMNESLVQRARNYLVQEFMARSQCTHFLFIDSDIKFEAKDIIALLALDKDIIGAPYPKKTIKWDNVKKAVIKNPNIESKDLEKYVGNYVFNISKEVKQFDVSEPIEVMELGTGYMMINRSVFERMRNHYPEMLYKPDHIGTKHFDGSEEICAYFDCIIDPDSKRYLSEDYYFCKKWREMGGKIYMCPWMKTMHIGTYGFNGDMPEIASNLGVL